MNMKRIAWVLLFVFLAVVAEAEEIIIIEDGDLVVKETKEKMRIPDVPNGLSAKKAKKLVMGELKEVAIKDETGKEIYSFSCPIKKQKTFFDRLVTYNRGEWMQRNAPSRAEERNDWFLTIFWLLVPALGILIISIVNITLLENSIRKLFVFYIAILAGMLAGGFVGWLTGWLAGGLAGMLAGGFVGWLTGGFAGGFAGELVGILVCWFTGMFAGVLASKGNYEIVAYYFVFILAVEIVSFVFAKIVGVVKKNMPAIKK